MFKEVRIGNDAKLEIQKGVDILANAVKVTLGPRGRHAAIERPYGPPLITKDGVSVARSINLKEPVRNMGAQLVKSVASATNSVAGDGTTTATVLAQAIFNEGMKKVSAGMNPVLIKRGLDIALDISIQHLTELSVPVENEEMLKNIAVISTNNDKKLGYLIGSVFSAVGNDGIISVEDSTGGKTDVVFSEGTKLDRGHLSNSLIINPERMTSELENAFIILYDDKLSSSSEFLNIISEIHKTGRPFLIVARDIVGEALATLVLNRQKTNLVCAAIKAPGFGDTRRDMIEDLAIMVGGKVFDNSTGRALADATIEDLGLARRVVVGRDSTTIIDGAGGRDLVERRIESLKFQLNGATDITLSSLKERISRLSGGAAIFKVGGSTESEMRERKDRVEDALNAVRAAIEQGILPGGGSALLQASERLESFSATEECRSLLDEERAGVSILRDSLREPFKQILQNSGFDHYKYMSQIISSGGMSGFDALNGSFVENMLLAGIIDPAKVVKTGLANAVSASGTLLTTEVCIFDDLRDFEQK
jgi:chaperonin GroEL